MKALAEAEQYVSGESLPATKVLRLAERLDKAREHASKADSGLLELARERVLSQLLRTAKDTVRVGLAKESTSSLSIRAGKGQRAPAATISLDRLPIDLRSTLTEELALAPQNASESTHGIDVGSLDPALCALYANQSANACLKGAESAEESYDYDRALMGFRLAVIRSQGDVATVRALVRFLTEVYADRDAVVRLLGSPQIPTHKHRDLRIALAQATHAGGQLPAAAKLYEELLAQADDPDLLAALADIDLHEGRVDKAQQRIKSVLKQDPSHKQARTLLDRCKRSLHSEADHWIARAQAALDQGELDDARDALDTLSRRKVHHPQITPLRTRLETMEANTIAADQIKRASLLADQGDWRQVVQLLRQAQQSMSSISDETASLLHKAEQAVAKEDCAHHLQEAATRFDGGNVAGALRSFHRALATNENFPDDVDSHPLLAVLRPTLKLLGRTAPTDRTYDGLAALFKARKHLENTAWDDAENDLRDARRHLRNHPEIDALEQSLANARAEKKQSLVATWIAEARRLEESDQLVEALEALENAVDLKGGDFDDTDAWRNRLRAQTSERSKRTSVYKRLQQLASQEDWWRLQRELNATGNVLSKDDTDVWQRRAQVGIQTAWQIETRSAPTKTPVGRLPLSALDWSPECQQKVIVHPSTTENILWLGAGQHLARVSLPNLRVQNVYGIPKTIEIASSTTRLFDWENRLILLDGNAKALTFLRFEDDQMHVEDRMDLSRILGGQSDPKRLVTETQLCPITGRLLVLETQQQRGRKSRLKSVSLDDGQVHHEESFPYPVFNLKPIHGDSFFTVQRLLDWSRPQANFYNFAVVDGHARIEKRIGFAELELPMHSIRHIARGGTETSDLYCQYNYLEPFTGQVSQGTCGFAQIRPDWDIYYQTNETERWFDDPRQIAGEFGIHTPSQSLIVPWRTLSDPTSGGLSVIAFKGFQHQWSATLPNAWDWGGLLVHPGSDHPVVIARSDEGVQLHSVDMENHSLVV